MRFTTATAALAVLFFATDLAAQRGGERNRWRRPEEITNRVGVFFTDIEGPLTSGDKVAEFETLEIVRAAMAAKQPTALYLVNHEDDEKVRQQFEWQLFQPDEVGIELRAFHCGRIDLAKNPALAAEYKKKAPLFVVIDANGKTNEVAMAGYKASTTSLKKALESAASGMKPSLPSFAKKYANLVEDLERLLQKREAAEKAQAKADSDSKRSKAEKELAKLAKEEKKLLDVEQKLITEARLPERGNDASRVGGRRPRRDRGGENGGENGGEEGGRRRGGGE